ncbi:hypothetical protein N7462_006207 [Penicillium macrosclerotiorum]|uniref:uncharacterized protein n=1 Tax=Penicillium macrosclerotiorum TaxID=303699 RepID=UPI002547CB31|nr:uncharacterized protein N7462_006207 [Penicillium macrosclerotiorum]KAJ5683042.1 hypothetical protein N7462_006207 [Penicillium macrosclerotiorum]
MDFQIMQSLLEEAKILIDDFQMTGVDSSRLQAQEKAIQIVRALERPQDAILKLAYSPAIFLAVKVAHDLKVFTLLAQATSPVPLAVLAAERSADPLLVERIMKVLVADGIVQESAPRKYLPTSVSTEMTQRASIGVIESMFIEVLPALQKTAEYLRLTNYRSPDDPTFAPFQFTNNLNIELFEWLGQNPDALTRFNSFMEGHRPNYLHWSDWFPVRERIFNHPDVTAESPLLVDIGGGRGHDLIAFRNRFPNAAGKLILEDLPAVIDEAQGVQNLTARAIDTVAYDFFTQVQPVRGARVYYLKSLLHDWSDQKATVILNNLKSAMKPGFSKILVEDYILPDQNARLYPCMVDLIVMALCAGRERTRQGWNDLFSSVGMKIVKFWEHGGDEMGIIEVELPD